MAVLIDEALSLVNGLSWIPSLLFLAGFILIAVELFNPGFGAPGISGLILLVLGIVFTAKNLVQAFILFILVVLILAIILFFVLKSASKGRLSRKLVLKDALNRESGYSSRTNLSDYLGKTGISNTVLRPSGTGTFDSVKLDIVAEGEYIPKDTPIEIVKVEGMRIVVKRTD